MRRNTPKGAYERYARTLQRIVGCVTWSRLTALESRNIEIDKVYAIVLNRGDGVHVSSPVLGDLRFAVGQQFRIIRDPEAEQGPFRATTVAYTYSLSLANGPDILSFHWTPETPDTSQRTFPHLHVEEGLLGRNEDKRLRSFNKHHVPTGRVSCESVVRFLIEELEVPPVVGSWRTVLDREEERFHRTQRAL